MAKLSKIINAGPKEQQERIPIMIGMNRTMGPSALITTRHISPRRAAVSSPTENHMELFSILRLRPLKGKEKEDHVVLEKCKTQSKDSAIAVLHPLMHLTSPNAKGPTMGSPDFIQGCTETEYHFDKVLDPTSTQETVFYAVGLNIATTAMEPLKKTAPPRKNQLLLALGMPNAGKTFSTFGKKARVSRQPDDGLVPRILDSLYSQSKHHIAGSKKFGVSIQLMLINKDKTTDLLVEQQKIPAKTTKTNTVRAMVASFETAKSSSTDNEVKIEQHGTTGEFLIRTSSKICRDVGEAREAIAMGISRSQQGHKLVNFGKVVTKGHVVITMQPVLMMKHEVVLVGGIITVMDMAGAEKIKISQRASSNNAMRDAIGSTSSCGAVLHCLRSIQHNQNIKAGKAPAIDFRCGDDDSMDGSDISNVSEMRSANKPTSSSSSSSIKSVPFRQSQLTMVLQPLFSHKGTTSVTLMMFAYPGHRDYPEKRSLLNDLEILQGSEIAQRTLRIADTGLGGIGSVHHSAKRPVREMDSVDDLILSDGDDEDSSMSANKLAFEPLPPPVAPRVPHHSVMNINDLPGVSLPAVVTALASPAVATVSLPCSKRSRDLSAPSAPVDDISTEPSRSYAIYSASPPMNPNYRPMSLVHDPVYTTPSIPPSMENIENDDVNKYKSPTRNWMLASPLKTITSAVNSTKKKGKIALEKMVPERMTQRPETTSNTYVEPNVSHSEMMKKIKTLEERNVKLIQHNSQLDEKCEALQKTNNRLVKLLNQGDKYDRRAGWSERDEKEWKQSRRRQLDDQKLIRSPLMNHIKKVQTTHDIKNRWTDAGKAHFLLDYPKDWTRARELDDRDRDDPFEPMLSPSLKEFRPALPSSRYNSEKRKINIQGRRLKHSS